MAINTLAIIVLYNYDRIKERYINQKYFLTLYFLSVVFTNIFALNVLYKSGCKCPDENSLSYDLMDTSKYNDIFKFIYAGSEDQSVNEETAEKNIIQNGDLIIWNGHVIIFESFVNLNGKLYANAWWAGTNQQNNGVNIINDVVHGKYPIEGEFIVRRPVLSQ